MRLFIYFILLFLILSCSKNDSNSSVKNQHLQYFGFAITDCGTNYTNQVDDFVNLIDMCLDNFSSLENRVTINTLNNNKVIIHLQALFINPVVDNNSPTGIRYDLIENYEEQFNLWKTTNSFLSSEKVAAFTVADEPAWNQMNMNDLAIITALIKQVFPDIPIMVIEAPDSINQLIITDNIDWVGFDRYGTIDPENDPEYLQRLQLIKSKRTNQNQKLVLIMESQWLDFYTEAGFEESILIDMSKSYFELAKKEEDVVALISYLLPSAFDSPDQKGFLELTPQIQQAIREIGNEILN
jgi:hypothetical protein